MEKSSFNWELRVFKDIHKDKIGVLLATGKTLKEYIPIVGENVIIVGVNHIYEHKHLLDTMNYYFFGSSYEINAYHKNCIDSMDKKIQKFASAYRDGAPTGFGNIHPDNAKKIDAIPFDCYISYPTELYTFTKEISENRMIGGTINFPALQFLLYTGVNKIYVVGCDVEEYHADVHVEQLKFWWNKFKGWLPEAYPGVEIIIVNPIGLKGLFTDFYQHGNTL